MKKHLLLLMLVLLIPYGISAQKKTKTKSVATVAKTEKPKYVKTVEGIKEYTLSNGLQVLLVPDASQNNVVVNIVYKVGSKNEGYGEKGMAHLLEHMLFKSTKNLGDIKKMLSDKGGNANGTTWLDRTNYYEIFPSTDENLQWSIQMEADRMINSTMLQSDLDKEFSVVRNEFEIGENDPESILMERINSTAYLWHNYGNSTIGSKEDIERVKADRLKVFYQKYYQPDNSVLIIGGKFDENKALNYISKYFSVIPKPSRVIDKTYTVEPPQDGQRYVELKRAGDIYAIGALYHTVSYSDKDYAAIDALLQILTSEPSGYFYKSLVDTKKVTRIYAWQPTLRDPGFSYFNVTIPKDKNIDQLKTEFLAELDKIGTLDYKEEDLARAKAAIVKNIENVNNNTISKVINLTEVIGAGDYRLNLIYRDNIEKLTLDDIKRVAKKYFVSNNRTYGVFIPSKDEVRVKNEEISDDQIKSLTQNYQGRAVEEVKSFEPTMQNVKNNLTEKSLKNGFKFAVLTKEIKGKKVLLTLRFPFGTEKTLENKSSLIDVMASMLKYGTKTLTREQIADKLDQMKTNLWIGGGGQNLTVSISTYEEFLAPTLDLLNKLLTESTFPQNEFEKAILERKSDIEANKNDPQSVAFLEISRLISNYPKSSIFYSATPDEQIEELNNVKREDVIAFYNTYLGSNYGTAAVVGNVEASNIQTLLEKSIGQWNTSASYAKVQPTYFPTKELYKEYSTPDKENAVNVSAITFKMNQNDAEYPALMIANEILGSGGFLNSRIAKRLREKEGISYGAGAWLSIPYDNDVANWGSYAFYNPTKKSEVNNALKDEIAKALKDGFTQAELTDAISSWKVSRKTDLGSDNFLLSYLNSHLYLNRSLDDFDQLEKKVDALKLDEVNQVLKKYISLDKLVLINAGDWNKK